MISKIYGSNQILFETGSRKGKLREEIQLNVEMKKDNPDRVYIQELKRAIAWKKPKKKKLNKAQRRAKFLKSPHGQQQTKNLNKSRKVMKTDAESTFKERNTNRIDIAQVKTDEYFEGKQSFYKRIGFDEKEDQIPSKDIYAFPRFLRNMPDACAVTNGKFVFIEAKGCQDILGLKVEDMEEYDNWEQISPICIFCYSTTFNELKQVMYTTLKEIAEKYPTKLYKDNGKLYHPIPWKEI